MFPADVPTSFTREYGCTLAEWLRDLPRAVGRAPCVRPTSHEAVVTLPAGGQLRLAWLELPPRQIALIRMPRLQVHFVFDNADGDARQAFMRPFDLTLQRGGG